jgi:hypothetical protein
MMKVPFGHPLMHVLLNSEKLAEHFRQNVGDWQIEH